jgi:uncharacterized membrane protein
MIRDRLQGKKDSLLMPKTERRRRKKPLLHYLFEIGITLKFVNGLFESIAGVALLLTPRESLSRFAAALLTNPLLGGRGVVAHSLLRAARHLSADAQLFVSIYFLVHGAVKVGLVIALWLERRWAYPLAGVVLLLFTVYQVYLFVVSGSLLQLFLTVLDVVILLLLWYEYRWIHRSESAP